jgi:2-polyprenyl-6-methoxyphenol hydroxylase-like FAD-dependent oxidoreductase
MIGKQAVVIGAGMGGLAAARALADHFDQVIVLERDALPSDLTPRAGTPQARHVHGLLSGGQQALAALFPGFEAALADAGAVPLRVGLDILTERAGFDPFPQRDLGRISYYMSRSLLELVMRRYIERLPNVSLRPCCQVRALEATPDGRRITGVHYEPEEGAPEVLPSDLVIDASGGGMPTLAMLGALGWGAPAKSTIGVNISYSTAIFEIPPEAPRDWKAVMTLPDAPRSKQRGVLFPLEGNRWMVTIGGMLGIRTPADEPGFLGHLRELRTQTIYNAVKHAKRLGDIPRYGFVASEWRHFERLEKFPHGVLPLGDAYCRFNPVYGQGMSVAVQEAKLLGELLTALDAKGGAFESLAPTYFAGARTLIEGPWTMVGNLDFIWPETTGQRPARFDEIAKFGSALVRLAAEDPIVHKLTIEVQHLLKPQSVYRDPALRQRVLALTGVI